ncbi:MAG: response regulator transcription factor, partial [Candidatus Acidiferrales bacterium]
MSEQYGIHMSSSATQSREKQETTASAAARILIVDDHEIVREGIRTLLRRIRPEWVICGEAKNGKESVEAAAALHPDILILDVTMPVMSGLEAASRIDRLGLASRVLIFTMHETKSLINEVRA